MPVKWLIAMVGGTEDEEVKEEDKDKDVSKGFIGWEEDAVVAVFIGSVESSWMIVDEEHSSLRSKRVLLIESVLAGMNLSWYF